MEIRLERSRIKGNRKIVLELQEIPAWQRVPLPETASNAPDSFRCFVCLEKRTKKRFAGWILNQPICRTCYPYLDEWMVSGIIKFDIKHGFGAGVKE